MSPMIKLFHLASRNAESCPLKATNVILKQVPVLLNLTVIIFSFGYRDFIYVAGFSQQKAYSLVQEQGILIFKVPYR